MADRKPIPILNLDSLVDRPVVVIDGKEYELVTPGILPPLDSYRFSRLSKRMDELLKRDDVLTEDEERELDTLPNRLCRLVLEAPDNVLAALTSKQSMDVVGTFLTAPWLMPAMPGRETTVTTPNPSIGESSSLASSPATGEIH